MSTLFNDIKDIDSVAELGVYGYIRRCQSLLPRIDAYCNIPPLVYCIVLSFHGASLQSSILTNAEICTLDSLLQQSGKGLSLKRWSLLHRGSRDGFSANAFHNKCDGKAKTLSIIRSDSNNVFGGYASVPWKGGFSYAADNDAFIFLIRSSKDYPPQVFATQKQDRKHKAVCHYSAYMCIFGGGYDICVHDNCNANINTYSYVNGNDTYMNLPTTHYLNGDTEQFKVLELEVFVCE
eukprot:140582_1